MIEKNKPKGKPKKIKRLNLEFELQVSLTDWFKKCYPTVVFKSDLGGIRFPLGLLKHTVNPLRYGKDEPINKFAFPDWSLPYESRGGWYSFNLELKKDKSMYLTKGGKLRLNTHIQSQTKALNYIRRKGHFGDFGGGLDEAKEIVNWYMSLSPTDLCNNNKKVFYRWPSGIR